MYANAIAQFFEYLCLDRQDFIPVQKKSKINTEKIDEETFLLIGEYPSFSSVLRDTLKAKFDKKKNGWIIKNSDRKRTELLIFSNSMSIQPNLTLNIADYVIKEIFHCSIQSEFSNVDFPTISPNMHTTIEKMIKAFIKNKDLDDSAVISLQTCSLLWKHISALCEYILESAKDRTENDAESEEQAIANVLNMSQSSVENMKRDFVNHGFNTDMENCILQAIVYNIVTLTDWLAVDNIGENEWNTCQNILTFNFKEALRIKPVQVNNAEVNNITRAFINKGLIIDNKTSLKILNFVEGLAEICEKDPDCINRIMFFSNII
jgi:hypothetical protein